MGTFQWDESLSVGIELIDDQHKLLIQRINDISAALANDQGVDKILKTLDFMIEYTHFHFSTEEAHMGKTGYPGLEDHRKKHEEFKRTLKNLEEDFEEEGVSEALAAAINNFMIKWLVRHIQGVDVEFGRFLSNKGIQLSQVNESG